MRVRWTVTGHEDGDTLIVSTPMINLLHCSAPGHDCTRRVPFVPHFSRSPDGPRKIAEPLVQSHESITPRVAGVVVGTGDVSIERHRHEQHRYRHHGLSSSGDAGAADAGRNRVSGGALGPADAAS